MARIRVRVRRLGPGDESLVERPEWLADPGHVMVVAFFGDEPAGMAYGFQLAHPHRPDGLLLYSLDTYEPYRRRGVGLALLEEMRRQASGPVWLLTNASNEAAIGLYRKAGGRRDNPDDVMFHFDPLPSE